MYGPGLAISDFNLGILYMLAVSSLATYGILLAGYPQTIRKIFILSNESVSYSFLFCIMVFFLLLLIDNTYCLLIIYGIFRILLLLGRVTNGVIYLLSLDKKDKGCLQEYRSIYNNTKVFSNYRYGYYFAFNKVGNAFIKNTQKRIIHTTKHLYSTYHGMDKPKTQESNIKSLHLTYINELYKDRAAPVIPFNREFILATCTNFYDKNTRGAFLKEWGSKSGIYLIEYKYDPLIYYIGRTTLFKRRFNNHIRAESGSKLHIFLNLIGWEHFNISIVETCTLDKLGERENFFIQNYLPLLNSVFFSSMTETAINITLKSKLDSLRESNSSTSFKYNEKAATEKKVLSPSTSKELIGIWGRRNYSTQNLSNKDVTSLNPWFITGFIDAEGCFSLGISKHKSCKTGYNVAAALANHLHVKDLPLLKEIQAFLGVGNIYTSKKTARYSVNSHKELVNIIIPFLDKYPLLSQKGVDFKLFKEIVYMMDNKEHLTMEGLKKKF